MEPIQSSIITSATATQVTAQRTRFIGVNLARTEPDSEVKVEVRNGTSGSSTVLFTFNSNSASHSSSMIFPSGSYILCEDGLHVTTTGSNIAGATLIYQT